MESFLKLLSEALGYAGKAGLLLVLFWLTVYFGIELGVIPANLRENELFFYVHLAGAAGVALIGLSALSWLGTILGAAWRKLTSAFQRRSDSQQLDQGAVASLSILTRDEAETLLFIFDHDLRRFQADIFSGEILSLRGKGILREEEGSGSDRRTFHVADSVWEHKEEWCTAVKGQGLTAPQSLPWSI